MVGSKAVVVAVVAAIQAKGTASALRTCSMEIQERRDQRERRDIPEAGKDAGCHNNADSGDIDCYTLAAMGRKAVVVGGSYCPS